MRLYTLTSRMFSKDILKDTHTLSLNNFKISRVRSYNRIRNETEIDLGLTEAFKMIGNCLNLFLIRV